MPRIAMRLVMVAVASLALAGCAGKKAPVGVDANTSATGVGGFGPGGVAAPAPGGYGSGQGVGQLYRDASGNLVDADGNRVDEFGNPISGAPLGPLAGGQGGVAYADGGAYAPGAGYAPGGNGVFLDGNGNFVDAAGNPVDVNGNPIAGGAYQGGAYAPGGTFATAPGGGYAGAGSYTFAGDDGSPGYFAQRVGDRVLFDTDSSNIDAEAQEILRRQAAWFRNHPEYAITVEGHADERGTRDYNLALGARRANAVRSYLSSLGIDPNRIRTVSYGKERPVRASSTPGAWRVNRRAVTTLRGGPLS